MPNVDFSPSVADGYMSCGGPGTAGSTYAQVRATGSGTFRNTTSTTLRGFSLVISGRGADFYDIQRIFLRFDLTSMPAFASITSATLNLYRYAGGGDSVYPVRHDQPDMSLQYIEYVFFPSHDPAGGDSMTAYGSENTDSQSYFSVFDLNVVALAEIVDCANDEGNGGGGTEWFEIALVPGGDYTNTTPTDRSESYGFYSQNHSNSALRPYLNVVYIGAGAATSDTTLFSGANF